MKNNPLRYSDPSGHKEVNEVDGGIPCYPGELVCQLQKSKTPSTTKGDKPSNNGNSPSPTGTAIPPVGVPNSTPQILTGTSTPHITSSSSTPNSTPTLFTKPPIVSTQTPVPPLGWTPVSYPQINTGPLEEAGGECSNDFSCSVSINQFVESLLHGFQPGLIRPNNYGPSYDWMPESYRPGPCQGRGCR